MRCPISFRAKRKAYGIVKYSLFGSGIRWVPRSSRDRTSCARVSLPTCVRPQYLTRSRRHLPVMTYASRVAAGRWSSEDHGRHGPYRTLAVYNAAVAMYPKTVRARLPAWASASSKPSPGNCTLGFRPPMQAWSGGLIHLRLIGAGSTAAAEPIGRAV